MGATSQQPKRDFRHGLLGDAMDVSYGIQEHRIVRKAANVKALHRHPVEDTLDSPFSG